MTKYIKIITLLLIPVNIVVAQESKSLIEVQSAVDTSVITIGDRITYTISIDYADSLIVGDLGEGVNLGQFEIKDYNIPDLIRNEGRILQKYEYVISVFDTGSFTIPAFPVAYSTSDSIKDLRIIEASPINIFVESIIQDDKKELRDIKPPINIPFDYIFIYSMIAAGILLGIIGYFGYRFYKKRKEEGYLFIPPTPPRPAHEVALESLDNLLKKNLIESGKIKEFYTEISELIRKYLEGRYFIKALEETSTEILDELKRQSIDENHYQIMQNFFVLSDIVKFAKYKTNDDENINIIDWARKFIIETKIEYKQEESKLEVNEEI